MQKKCFVFLTLFAFISPSAVADDLLRINADIRYRWEYENHFNQKFYGKNPPKGDSDDGFLLQRIRLTFDFKPHKNVHLSMGLQDSRAYDVALPDDAFYKSRLCCLQPFPYSNAGQEVLFGALFCKEMGYA